MAKKPTAQKKKASTLSNEELAQAALAFIDQEGIEALSFRKLADKTGMPTMTICNRFGSREDLLRAALSAMLDEVPIEESQDETWQEGIRRIAHLNRDMALRHPKAFMLFVLVPIFESPVYEFTNKVYGTHEEQNLPEDMPAIFLSLMHSFVSGFQLAEMYANEQKATHGDTIVRGGTSYDIFNEESFNRNLEVVITGLQEEYDLPQE